MTDKSKLELALDFLTIKENTEALFNNLTWFLFCAGLVAIIKAASAAGYWFAAIVAAGLFFLLLVLSMSYGMSYLVVPLVEAMFPGWKLADTQREGERVAGFWAKAWFGLRFTISTPHGAIYALLSVSYMYFALEVVEVAMNHIPGK